MEIGAQIDETCLIVRLEIGVLVSREEEPPSESATSELVTKA